MVDDVELLLALLNSRPVLDGTERDELATDDAGRAWAAAHGGTGGAGELRLLRQVRDGLTDVALGRRPLSALAGALDGVHRRPVLDDDGLSWELAAADDVLLPARAVLAWAWVAENLPGRLRPCGNDECRLFLLDRSKANRARWCSMATCGNRMKARRHYERTRKSTSD
ncbi:CGNR zinc finger domain-containing protein [Saccharopolyspora gregorii]|uniref:CGNR zinc finger domain-containing protein n=1 Tax=Saccharopolyspora gregorii TaxID=33914 RepID=A0ABP6RN06_9PSEU|nr:CGNR zinc finger domain-containing protein [Saccharopolyspora gregorii]